MDRLTDWDKGNAYFPKCFEEPCRGCGPENDCDDCDFMMNVCRKLAQYEDIGTLGEVSDAVEKQNAKKPIFNERRFRQRGLSYGECVTLDTAYNCPRCNLTVWKSDKPEYCDHCGQRLNWGEEE